MASFIVPDPKFCFGRETLADEIPLAAVENRSVLLFGGRQAGKTTLLLRMALNMEQLWSREEHTKTVGVYFNAQTLPDFEGPEGFLRAAAKAIRDVLLHLEPGATVQALPSATTRRADVLDLFKADLSALRESFPAVQEVVLLVDEVKKIVTGASGRGFLDNLFSLLYDGERAEISVSIVFSGAQDLYLLCEDGTSPIGSRASAFRLRNLEAPDIANMLRGDGSRRSSTTLKAMSEKIEGLTGGHAGLSRRISVEVARWKGRGSFDFSEVVQRIGRTQVPLLRLWRKSLSREAALIHDHLHLRRFIGISEIGEILAESGRERWLADKVCEELEFTGIGRVGAEGLEKVNAVYWDYMSQFLKPPDNGTSRDVWILIERLETELRMFIRSYFEIRWGGNWENRIAKILSGDWGRVQRVVERRKVQYRFSDATEGDVLQYLYLGQLGQVMWSSEGWKLFSRCFRDKRELQDLIGAVAPVRNDVAHFRVVPRKELERCRIACEDLLEVVRREKKSD